MFNEKVAIVTGGSSGIGKEVARRFVQAGGSVVIGGRNADKLASAAAEIDVSVACCRFRGHEDKVFMKLENVDGEKSI